MHSCTVVSLVASRKWEEKCNGSCATIFGGLFNTLEHLVFKAPTIPQISMCAHLNLGLLSNVFLGVPYSFGAQDCKAPAAYEVTDL